MRNAGAVKAPVIADVLDEECMPFLFVGSLFGCEAENEPAVRPVGAAVFAVEDHHAGLAFEVDNGFERSVVPVVHPQQTEL